MGGHRNSVRTIAPTQGRLQLVSWLRELAKDYFGFNKVVIYNYANENEYLFQSDLILEFCEDRVVKIVARVRKPGIAWYQNVYVYKTAHVNLADLINIVAKSKQRNGHIAIKEGLAEIDTEMFETILEAARNVQFCLLERLAQEIQAGIPRIVEKSFRYSSISDPNQSRLEFMEDGSVIFVCPWETN